MRLFENFYFEIEISANTIKCLLIEEGFSIRDVYLYGLLIELGVGL
jgi:hypothetical protein